MITLSRKKLGYAPGSMDAVFLRQDIDALDAAWRSAQETYPDLLLASSEFETEARRLGVPDLLAKVLIQRANMLLASGRDLEAITTLKEADQVLGPLRQYDLKVYIYAGLAAAYAHLQDWQKVSDVCEEGIALVEKYRYKVSGQYLQSAYLRSRIDLYRLGVQAAYERQQYPLMLQRAELSKCRFALRYGQKSLVPAEKETQTEEEFRQVCQQIDAARAAGNGTEPDVLLAKRRILWDLLVIQREQARREDPFPEFNLAAVQATLAGDEAIVYYYWLDRYTLLITAIDQQHVVPLLRFLSTEQQTQLKAFADFVLKLTPTSAVSHLDSVQDFSSLLLPEEAACLIEKKQRLLFSPHRLLHAIPFHALRWNANFLFERFAVTYVPNLSSLLYTYAPSKQQRVLALGIREYAVPGYSLRSLKTAEQEVEGLKQLCEMRSIPITALKGSEAGIERLRQLATTGKLEQFTCVHFATHGFNVDSDTPMESYLFLRDSRLDGLEIANWQLHADVVVLSACCSGQRPISGRGMEELPGDELFGLQSAFFTAGAKRILSSLWPVDDAVAFQVTKSFHQHITGGTRPEVALQTAMKEFLEAADIDQDGVYYWGPFFLSAMGCPVFYK